MSEPPPIAGRVLGIAKCHDDVVDLWRARKDELGLSDAFFDELSGLAVGQGAKIMGPSRVKSFGKLVFDIFNQTLAVKFVMVEDVEAAMAMEGRWQRRMDKFIRRTHPVSASVVARAKPAIYAALSRAGVEGRKKMHPAKRAEIARKAGRASGRARRRKQKAKSDGDGRAQAVQARAEAQA